MQFPPREEKVRGESSRSKTGNVLTLGGSIRDYKKIDCADQCAESIDVSQ